jgi:hypothetical protein
LASLIMGFATMASPRLSQRYDTVKAIVMCQDSSITFMLALAFVPDR